MAMSKAPVSIRLVAVVVTFLCLSLSAYSQRDDWHMDSLDVFVKSAFAHGYMHGYEEGFHVGDLDMQMGRNYREVKNQEQYKKPLGYRASFGERDSYDDGYHNGYLVGYTDCYGGRNFRAIRWMRQERQLRQALGARSDRSFDSAFKEGYKSGQKRGLQDGRAASASDSNVQCDTFHDARGGTGEPHGDYCGAFRSGYELGYSDGYANQRQWSPPAKAEKVVAKK
jgi:hypothetical protein